MTDRWLYANTVVELRTPTPRYRHLTRAYVDWLGLTVTPVRLPRQASFARLHAGAALPSPGAIGWVPCVAFENAWYVRSNDGLSFDLWRSTPEAEVAFEVEGIIDDLRTRLGRQMFGVSTNAEVAGLRAIVEGPRRRWRPRWQLRERLAAAHRAFKDPWGIEEDW